MEATGSGPMVQHIIVGFDGSPTARAALRWAAAEARLHCAELVALTAQEGPGSDATNQPSIGEEATDGYPVTMRSVRGDAAAALITASAAAGLLVVGSRGQNPLVGLALGSVSRRCVEHASCPVVVVRSQPRRRASGARVVVGVDMSGHSRAALRIAAEEARLRDAQLDVVHAVYWDPTGTALLRAAFDQLVEWGHRLVAAELTATGVTGNPVVLPGHAPDVLVQHSADADLLVLGPSGHSAVAGFALGSVSDHCVRHAECPVMITRTPGVEEDNRRTHAEVRASDGLT